MNDHPTTPFKPSAFPAFVPRFLTRPARPVLTIILAYILAFAGSVMLAAIVGALLPQVDPPEFEGLEAGVALFALIVFAPFIETLIMAGALSILLRFVGPVQAILFSAFGWAIAHSLSAATWGLVIWWPFLIFSTLYVVWKERSLLWGLAMPMIVHAMQNALPAITVAYPETFVGVGP